MTVTPSTSYIILCRRCGLNLDEKLCHVACPACGGPLDFQYPHAPSMTEDAPRSMWKYRGLLPVRPGANIVSLGEGGTPLQKARFREDAQIYVKNETVNPTGSHKDRALSIGITQALEFGRDAVMLYSDGSTALSSAAYAARAGLKSFTVVGRGTPGDRLRPLAAYGSHVLEYQGTPAQALDWAHEACRKLGIYETSTYRLANPYQAEGPKTIGFEIFEQLGRAPDWIVVPVGGGGTLAGIWRAFVHLRDRGLISKRPRMAGVLPEHYTMLETALKQGVTTDEELRKLAPREVPPTIQAKIAMAWPPDGLEAVSAVRESGGLFLYASDRQALTAQKELGAFEGIYAEPSAAVAWAGVQKVLSRSDADKRETVVAVVTGSGFRETGALSNLLEAARVPVDGKSGLALLEDLIK